MSYIGTNKVGKMYLGSTAIGKAYLGDDLVYDSAGGSVTPVLPDGYAQLDYVQGITRTESRLSKTTVVSFCQRVYQESFTII